MMAIAAGLGPEQEIYSIDESFICLDGMKGGQVARSHRVRERTLQWIGVPCGIGLGATKTLAKLANHIAKTADRRPGSYPASLARVCNLGALPASDLEAVLAATELGEVWGIGPRIGAQLQAEGLRTVLDPGVAHGVVDVTPDAHLVRGQQADGEVFILARDGQVADHAT
jgi:DNA polymerase V